MDAGWKVLLGICGGTVERFVLMHSVIILIGSSCEKIELDDKGQD